MVKPAEFSLRPRKPMTPRCASPRQMPQGFGGSGRSPPSPTHELKKMRDFVPKSVIDGGLDELAAPLEADQYPAKYAQRECVLYPDLTLKEWLQTRILPIFGMPDFGKIPSKQGDEMIALTNDFSEWKEAVDKIMEEKKWDTNPAQVYSMAPVSVLEYLGY